MKKLLLLLGTGVILAFTSIFCWSSAFAVIPHLISYQGMLTDNSGTPLTDTVSVIFKIYDNSSGGNLKWQETQNSVPVINGLFNVILGSVTPIDTLSFSQQYWLDITVDGETMTSRLKFTSVGYAYRAQKSDTASVAISALSGGGWTDAGTTVRLSTSTDSVGIGMTSPNEKLTVEGALSLDEINAPSATGGYGKLYVKSTDSNLYFKDDGGSEYNLASPVSAGGWTDDGAVVRLTNGTDKVGIGTATPNDQLEMTGNLRLPATTATTGIIKVGADRFISSYGTGNTFVGRNAGNLTMSGNNNTASGCAALYNNTTGYDNTASGCAALYNNTTGNYNTANGKGALYANTTGNYNTANGEDALYANTTGNYNTANGYRALYLDTSGYSNTANGYMALYSNTEGYYNLACGYGALDVNTTGHSNTALGWAANVTSSNLFNATAIGSAASVDASNKVRIGNASVTSIGGQVGWTDFFADGRYKKGVSENVPGLAFISKLRPVTYSMDVDAFYAANRPYHQLREGQNPEDLMPSPEEIASRQAQSEIVYTGFIAQEVEQAAQEVGYDFSGVDAPKNDQGMYGLRYAEFVVPLVKAMQEQQQLIQEQQQMIQELQKRIEELEKK